MHDALARGNSYVVEVTNMRADGSRFPVEVHSARFHEDGAPRIVAVARDLSARVEAERRYRSLVESIDLAVTVQDESGRVHYMNSAAGRIFALDPGEERTTALEWSDWLVLDENGVELPVERYPLSRALREERTISGAVIGLYRRSTQKLLWLSVTSVPQYDPGAEHARLVLSVSTDITGLKRDASLFERVQDLALIGGWQWDRVTDELHLTPEAVRILGRSQAPASMQEFLACLDGSSRDVLDATLASIGQGTGFDQELHGTDPEGWRIWVRMVGEPDARDPGGRRLAGTLQDITERKRAEAALRLQASTCLLYTSPSPRD